MEKKKKEKKKNGEESGAASQTDRQRGVDGWNESRVMIKGQEGGSLQRGREAEEK